MFTRTYNKVDHDTIASLDHIICLICSDKAWRGFFLWMWRRMVYTFYWLAYLWAVLSPSLSQAGFPACGGTEVVWLGRRGPEAQPQAPWTLCPVWTLPAGCSSHCVIERIMFRDSLSSAPPWVPLERLGALQYPKNEARSASGRVTPRHCSSSAAEPVVSPQQWDCPQMAEFIHGLDPWWFLL